MAGVPDQALNVHADVLRPLADEFVEAVAVTGVEGAGGLFIVRRIACQ